MSEDNLDNKQQEVENIKEKDSEVVDNGLNGRFGPDEHEVFYDTKGKKVVHFIIGLFGVWVLLSIGLLIATTANTLNVTVSTFLLDIILMIAAVIAGVLIIRRSIRKYLGIGILVGGALPLVLILVTTGGCGIFFAFS